jgi:F-type H+-transporting ATPase subunit b
MRCFAQRLFSAMLLATCALSPAVAWASAAGGEGASPIYNLIMKFVNFGILAGILFYFLRKPVSQSLADRREDIKRQLDEAREAKEAAEAKYQEYKGRVANLEQEIRQIQEDFRAEGDRLRARIVEDSRQAAEGIRRQAEAAGASEVRRAIDDLRAEVGDLAVQVAAEMLAKAYTAADQKKAVQDAIENVERAH